MKTYNSKFLWIAAVSLAFASCADDELQPFQAEEPENIHQLDYLDAYGPLKSYVDRAANPGFKLGVAVDEAGFIDKGVVYSMASSNFEDITPGNAMKHSSVVNAAGEMDFTTVKELIEAAKGAGMSIYGHTLCWHSQQQADYLNRLIADKVLPDDPTEEPVEKLIYSIDYAEITDYPFGEKDNLQLTDGALIATYQGSGYNYIVGQNFSTIMGDNYKVKVCVKASENTSIDVQFGDWGNVVNAQLPLTTEWTEVTLDMQGCTVDKNCKVIFQPWENEATISLKWVEVYHVTVPEDVELETVMEDDFEDGNIDGWGGWGGTAVRSLADEGCESNHALQIVTTKTESGNHVVQNQYSFNFENGTTYRLAFDVKGNNTGSAEVVAQIAGSPYTNDVFKTTDTSSNLFPITTDWTRVEMETTITGSGRVNLLINTGTYNGTLLFDNFTLSEVHPANVEEIPDEEKKELIRAALEDFIKGMMEACGGYVKVWDVVNEPMSDSNPSQLKSEAVDGASDGVFYWQDYLGEDYARYAVEYARKYFKEYGGNEEELLLFVNDYNLEASYNSNAKCEGLINMVKKWESDGVTRIDGIGTQLHVSYSISPTQQKRNEECIVKMFELLAASGKKIKISEIDLGLTDANGKAIVSTNTPPLIHQLGQAEYYNFIIRKYFEIIPAEQRYGITLWSMTDSPNTEYSFWRKGEPIGLWDLNYNRKPAYAGFAEGLAGKDAPVPEEYSYLFTEEAAEGGE